MSQLLLDKLDGLARAWLNWMSSMSLHVALLVVFLLVCDRCLRRLSGRLRFAMWLLVLARLVVPPDLALPTGWMWWTSEWWPSWTAWSPELSLPASADVATPLSPEVAAPSIAGDSVMAAQGASSSMSSWHVSLFMIWLGAVVCQLGLMAYGWLLVESWLAQAHDVTNPRIGQLLESARRRVGLKRTVRLSDSGQCTTPLVVGWIRPVILLPTAVLESLKPAELEAVLVHELTHLARGDGWWRVLQSILRTFYFFHPAVWLAGRALARTCEEACDELTVKALAGQRREYAEAIFKAAALVGYHGPHLALNMLGDVMPVKARLSRILDPRLPQSSGGSWRHALIVMLLAIVLLPTGVRRTQAIPPASAILSDWQHSAEASPPATVSDQAANNQAANSQAANNEAIEDPAIDTQAVDRSSQAQQGEIEQALQSAPPRSDLERQALELLKSEHFEQRLEGYATLAKIGTIHSLADLESAFLTRSGIEQDAAERALKHVWTTIRNQPAESNTSARIYSEAPKENLYELP